MIRIIRITLLLTFALLSVVFLNAQNDTLYLSFVSTDIKCGETKAIKMQVKNFKNIVTLNFSIKYNKALIDLKNYTGANPLSQTIANELVSGDYADGNTFSWNKSAGTTLTDGDFLNFNMEPKPESGGLNGTISITASPVAIKAEALDGSTKKAIPVKVVAAPFRIVDDIAPSILCPTSKYVSISGTASSATVSGLMAVFTDEQCGKASIGYELTGATTGNGTNQDATGVDFNIGTTNVKYIVKDNSNNEASCQFQVNVVKGEDVAFFTNAPIVECSDSTFTIETRVANYVDVTSVDYAFFFDKNVLELKSIQNVNKALNGGDTTYVSGAFKTQGFVQVTLSDPNGVTLPNNSLLYKLTFRKIGGAAAGIFEFKNVEVALKSNPQLPVLAKSVANIVPFADNITPTIQCPKDTIVFATTSQSSVQMFGIQATASDNCQLEPITYNFSGATTLASTINVNGKFFNVGVTKVNVNAQDYAANTKTCEFNVIVKQLQAQIVSDTVDCKVDTVQMNLTVKDFVNMKKIDVNLGWNKDSLLYQKTTFNLPASLVGMATATGSGDMLAISINNITSNGVNLADNYVIAKITYKVLNASLNKKYKVSTTISTAQLIDNSIIFGKGIDGFLSVLDTEGPKIVGCPKDTILKSDKCLVDYNWIKPQAADFCSMLSTENTNAPINAAVQLKPNSKPYLFFYEFSDVFGNKSRCEFKVTAIDTIKPKISNCVTDTLLLPTDDLVANCGGKYPTLTAPIVVENCEYRITSTYKSGDFVPNGISKQTIIVRDSSGNSTSCERFVNVKDGTKPKFDAAYFTPQTKIIFTDLGKCGANYTWTDPTATDNCSSQVTISADKAKGSFFEVKQTGTPITFTATDAAGNVATQILNIAVIDNELPKFINCPNGKRDTTLYVASNSTDCRVVFNPPVVQYTDNCSTNIETAIASGMASNNIYAIGKYTITYTAASPVALCEFTVNVVDTTKPTIICPFGPITRNANNNCIAIIPALPQPVVLSDNCSGAFVNYRIEPLITQYQLGSTKVNYIATDSTGNEQRCTLEIIVRDAIKPVLTCPQTDVTLNADADVDTATASWTEPSATDNCGSKKVNITSNYANNTKFKVGTTVVTYIAKDSTGNETTCSFNVKVLDNQPPKIVCPTSAISVPTTVNCEARYSLLQRLSATDNHKITIRDSIGTQANALYKNGTYNLKYSVIDSSGLQTVCDVTLNILDREAPKKLTCPAPKSFMALAGNCDYKLNSINDLEFPTFADNCDATLTYDTIYLNNNIWTKGLPPNLVFKAGENSLAVVAYDSVLNRDTCIFKVNITGNIKPSIAATDCGIGDIIKNAQGCGTPVTYDKPIVTYSPCGDKDTESYNFESGTSFAIGTHTIIFTAKDKAGSTATCSFKVTIKDVTKPTINFDTPIKKDTIVESATSCSMKVNWAAPTLSDLPCDTTKITLIPDPIWKSGDTFPVGITPVVYKAIDAFGNDTSKILYIQLLDNLAPTFTKCPQNVEVGVDGTVIADPSKILETVLTTNPSCDSIKLAYKITAFEAVDNCDPSVNKYAFPINFSPIVFNSYPIGEKQMNVVAFDKSGNSSNCSFKITVKPWNVNPKATVSDTFPCVGDAVTLKVDSIAGVTTNWTGVGNFKENKASVTIKNLTSSMSGKYFVQYQKSTCKSLIDSVSFTVLTPPTVKEDTLVLQAGTTQSSNILSNDDLLKNVATKVTWQSPSPLDFGTFTGKDNGEFSYQATKGKQGWVRVLYKLCYDNCPDACVENKSLWIEVTKDVPTDCRVPNLITPNGDSFNDKLEIECIGATKGAKLYIYSQWGEQVYTSDDYQNDWEGTWKGKPLPDGTYFFVFQLNPTAEMKKGYIVIFR